MVSLFFFFLFLFFTWEEGFAFSAVNKAKKQKFKISWSIFIALG